MSKYTYLKGMICLYSHLSDPLSLSHNNYWLHWQNLHLLYLFQKPGVTPLPMWEGLYMHPIFFIIDIYRNVHFWTFTYTIKLFQPFIQITLIFISKWNFHTFIYPFTILILPWYIRLILLYRLLLVVQSIPLQVQLPPLPTVQTLWTWRIKS